jgi:hypothetical protein
MTHRPPVRLDANSHAVAARDNACGAPFLERREVTSVPLRWVH